MVWTLYHRVEGMNQSIIWSPITGRNPMDNHNGDTQFSPEVHVLAGTLRPYFVDQHLVVRRLRGVAWTSSSLGHRKNWPTSEVTQWHEQSTKVTFRLSAGKVQDPSQSPGDSHEQSPTRANAPPLPNRSPSATRCNHSSKCTWNHSQSHKDE